MTVKEVFDLRKQGKIEEAYEAIRPMFAVHQGKYTTLCMFWTASVRATALTSPASSLAATIHVPPTNCRSALLPASHKALASLVRYSRCFSNLQAYNP